MGMLRISLYFQGQFGEKKIIYVMQFQIALEEFSGSYFALLSFKLKRLYWKTDMRLLAMFVKCDEKDIQSCWSI